ncbi:hypothetical protein P7C70_g3547, partial [Phenoliferia sp. Uapishka_3]
MSDKEAVAAGEPEAHVTISQQEAHTRAEALADERIAEREQQEAHERPHDWQPPTVVHGREPLATVVHRASVKRGGRHAGETGEHGPKVGMPDMEGVTHIPESELPVRHERSEHTALRPSDPNDPNSMDGKPNPTSAGDDYAI